MWFWIRLGGKVAINIGLVLLGTAAMKELVDTGLALSGLREETGTPHTAASAL